MAFTWPDLLWWRRHRSSGSKRASNAHWIPVITLYHSMFCCWNAWRNSLLWLLWNVCWNTACPGKFTAGSYGAKLYCHGCCGHFWPSSKSLSPSSAHIWAHRLSFLWPCSAVARPYVPQISCVSTHSTSYLLQNSHSSASKKLKPTLDSGENPPWVPLLGHGIVGGANCSQDNPWPDKVRL